MSTTTAQDSVSHRSLIPGPPYNHHYRPLQHSYQAGNVQSHPFLTSPITTIVLHDVKNPQLPYRAYCKHHPPNQHHNPLNPNTPIHSPHSPIPFDPPLNHCNSTLHNPARLLPHIGNSNWTRHLSPLFLDPSHNSPDAADSHYLLDYNLGADVGVDLDRNAMLRVSFDLSCEKWWWGEGAGVVLL